MYYSIALTKRGEYCHTKTTLVHVCMYNYKQEIVYFICVVFILTGGPGSNKNDLAATF